MHINNVEKSLEMFFHSLDHDGKQRSLRATSNNGLTWQVQPKPVSQIYLRIFRYKRKKDALGWGGQILRENLLGIFELGPWTFGGQGHRHADVLVNGEKLHVMWTRIGDAPECIFHSTIDLANYWRDWYGTEGKEILRSKFDRKCAHIPTSTSTVGGLTKQEPALRDPHLFEESEEVYMIYAGAEKVVLALQKYFSDLA